MGKTLEENREYQRNWRRAKKLKMTSVEIEAFNEYRRIWQRAARAKWTTEQHEAHKAYLRSIPPEVRKARALKYNYGITPEQFDAFFLSQGNCCRICKTIEPGGRNWHVDHCHASGKIRGILCCRCNVGIGMFRNNPVILMEASSYIDDQSNKG
jgi:hypothetical protein